MSDPNLIYYIQYVLAGECIRQKVGRAAGLGGSYRSYSVEFGIVHRVSIRASKLASEVAGLSATLLNLTESLS